MKISSSQIISLTIFVCLGVLGYSEVPKIREKIRVENERMAEEDAIINSLETTDVEGEKFLGRDNVLFQKALSKVVKVFKQQGVDLNTVRGITQTSGFVFVAFDNGDYKRMGEFGQFKEGLRK